MTKPHIRVKTHPGVIGLYACASCVTEEIRDWIMGIRKRGSRGWYGNPHKDTRANP